MQGPNSPADVETSPYPGLNCSMPLSIRDPHHALLPPGADWERARQLLPVEACTQMREWFAASKESLAGRLDDMPDVDAACRVLLMMDFPKVRCGINYCYGGLAGLGAHCLQPARC